jgi:NTE family protein
MDGRRIRENLLRVFSDREFSDTAIPVRVVAVDLDTGEELALSEGSLVDAIRATISVPGVLCPADWRGRRLADGGLTNSVPADVARDMGAECVIAVDVGHTAFEPLSRESARRLLSLPGLAGLSPVAGILTRSLHIMEAEITRERLEKARPDLVIRPAIGPINIEEFDRAAEVIPTGERAAAEALPHLRAAMRRRLFWAVGSPLRRPAPSGIGARS